MRKAMTMFLVLILAVPLFANGGRDQEAASDEPVNLIWYVPAGGTFPYADAQDVYDALNEILLNDLGITVTIKATGGFGEYRETMPLSMAAGEPFDIVWTSHWSNDFLSSAADGLYAPLDDLLVEYAPTIWKDTGDSLEAARVDGSIRGVWGQQIAAKTSNYVVREPQADRYGWDLDSVNHISDIEPFLADILANEPGIYPLSARKPLPEWQMPYLGITGVGVLTEVLGVRVTDESCTVFNLIEDPEYVAMIELARDWYNKGYVAKDGLTFNNDQWMQLWNTGKIAIDVHNTWKPGQDVETAPFEEVTRRIPFGGSFVEGQSITSTLQAIGTMSEHKVEAVKLLEYMWTHEEAYNLLVWGIDGRHYAKNEDGTITPDPDGGYYTNTPWVFGNTFISYVLEGQSAEAPSMTYDLNQSADKATLMGFNLDVEPVKSLVASVGAVKDQYYVAVSSGYSDTATELPEYLDALKKAGIDELIDEVQAQVDSWLESR